MVYIVEGPKYSHKRHQNQLQKRRLNDSNDVPQKDKEPIDTIFDMFDLDPSTINTWNTSVREKKEIHRPVNDRPKKKKKLTALLRSKRLEEGCCGSLTHFTIMDSPLLVLRDFTVREANKSRSEPLQVMGSASASRVICGTDLAECVSVPGYFLRSQGAFPPGFYPLRGGGSSPGAWGAPNKGNTNGAVGIFGNAGRV